MSESATPQEPNLDGGHPGPALGPAGVERLSLALRHARQARLAIPPLTDELPDLSLQDAYAIARRTIASDVAGGARVVGHKIGLTSDAVQKQLSVSEPDYGALLHTMEVPSDAVLDARDFLAPRVELELAFRLHRPLTGPGVTAADVRAATETVHPAIEIVDSRIADWRIQLADTVADNASSAGFVIGTQGYGIDELDVTAVEVSLYKNGGLVEEGRSEMVLGDPCEAVAWLANALDEFGDSLTAGEIVLSGACTRMASANAGDSFRGVFHGLDELGLSFAGPVS